MYEKRTLPNGLRVIMTPVAGVRGAAVRLFVGAGSRYDPAELSGMAHFLEHMVFEGTASFPSTKAISIAIDGVGGIINASTGRETTAYEIYVANRYLERAMHVISDMALHPVLDPAEFDRERNVITEEIRESFDSPGAWAGMLSNEAMWPSPLPLGREIAGTEESVKGIQEDNLRAFMRQHYVPGNAVLSVAGGINIDEVMAQAERYFGPWEPGPVPVWAPSKPPADAPRVRLGYRRTQQTTVILSMPSLSRMDPDVHVLSLLNTILGGGSEFSRLFQRVRDELGLAYYVASGGAEYYDCGSYVVEAGVQPTRVVPALRAVLDELDRLRQEPVPADELEMARASRTGRVELALDSPTYLADWFGDQELTENRIQLPDEVLALYAAVTPDDIQRMAQRLFDENLLRLVLVGPHKTPGQFERALTL
jgi:predicted Zn-dependent peptidase